MNNEKSYLIFVLGYDLLQERLSDSYLYTCDTAYEICSNIIDDFMNSDEYKNNRRGVYEMLETWLNNNWDYVFEKYWGIDE